MMWYHWYLIAHLICSWYNISLMKYRWAELELVDITLGFLGPISTLALLIVFVPSAYKKTPRRNIKGLHGWCPTTEDEARAYHNRKK